MSTRILLAGAGGQLGAELKDRAPEWAAVIPMSFEELDIRDPEACFAAIQTLNPDWIINAAAYTDVEKAELEPDLAMKTNFEGVQNLTRAVSANGIRLVHISTDFVFDGNADQPYTEEAKTAPLNEYGKSKLAGEKPVLSMPDEKGLVIRTSWLYGPRGRNFVTTILKALKKMPFLQVVNDQFGSPTSVRSLANVIYRSISLNLNGLYHWCDAGVCSWYDFAVEIQNQALETSLLTQEKKIIPISTSEFFSRAIRPRYSALNQQKLAGATSIDPLPWQMELKMVIDKIVGQQAEY